jgi:hypothetical protein
VKIISKGLHIVEESFMYVLVAENLMKFIEKGSILKEAKQIL